MSCNNSCVRGSILYSVLGLGISTGISVLICLVAVFLVFALRLYKRFVYRLSLYQVLAAISNGVFLLWDLHFRISSDNRNASGVDDRFCKATAYLTQFSLLLKLFFTIWLTFHLFCFAVYNKNLKKLEILYLGSSFLVPASIAVIPFLTKTYGVSKGWCWIMNTRDAAGNCTNTLPLKAGTIEQFALWYGPAIFTFSAESGAMVVLLAVLAWRAYKNRAAAARAAETQPLLPTHNVHKQALNQMLPLVVYPFVFGILITPPMVNRILDAVEGNESRLRCELDAVFIPLLFLAAGLTLIVHVCLVQCSKRKRVQKHEETATIRRDTGWSTRCSTAYIPPLESEAALAAAVRSVSDEAEFKPS